MSTYRRSRSPSCCSSCYSSWLSPHSESALRATPDDLPPATLPATYGSATHCRPQAHFPAILRPHGAHGHRFGRRRGVGRADVPSTARRQLDALDKQCDTCAHARSFARARASPRALSRGQTYLKLTAGAVALGSRGRRAGLPGTRKEARAVESRTPRALVRRGRDGMCDVE